jgi:hypothetical protein
MSLDRTDVIAGQPIQRVRDWLRTLRGEWSRSAIAEHFSLEDPEELLVELKRRQLLVDGEYRASRVIEPCYAPGALAARFAAARLLRPISRKKANELVEGLLERIAAVNDNPDLLMSVIEARVFGSYLDPLRDPLGDVDVAIKLENRALPDDVVAASLARARLSGRRFGSYVEELGYGELEVWRALKGRRPHLSLHTFDELARLGRVESRALYPRPSS